MADSIRQAFDAVRASEQLKERTKQRLEQERMRRSRPPLWKLAAAAVALLLLVGVGGRSLWLRPVSFVSVDVNPSVELTLNRLDRVVEVRDFTQGEGGIAGNEILGKNMVQAVGTLLEREQREGLLRADSLLSFTVRADTPRREAQLLQTLERTSAGLEQVQVTYATADESLWREAHSHGLSAGKYRAILELLEADPSATLEEARHCTMMELHQRTHQHSQGGAGCCVEREDPDQVPPPRAQGRGRGRRRGHHE